MSESITDDNKCPTCTGEKSVWSTSYCHKHDVCKDCGGHHDDFEERSTWGASEGAFRCHPCQEIKRLKGVEERQGAGFDHDCTPEVVCPYCGNQFSDSWDFADEDEMDCDECGNTFSFTRDVDVTYNSEKIGEG